MHRDAVDSTALASIGYEPESRTLEIEFRSGSVYRYFEVEQEVYERLLVATSRGRFFSRHIRDRYPYVRE